MGTNRTVPGVAFYGKVRIPTLGHMKAVTQAEKIAEQVGGQVHIGLTGASSPLSVDDKKSFSESLFGRPVESGNHTKNLINYLSHLSEQHEELYLVAGSDRAAEYRRVISKYNGKTDNQGNILFEFKKWKVVEVIRPGTNVSATLLEGFVKADDYKSFKSYYPGISDQYTRKLFETVKKKVSNNYLIENTVNETSIPAIGQTLSRDLMPQISGKSLPDFLRFLKKQGIEFHKDSVDPSTLKSTQSEFDDSKIFKMMFDKDSNDPIIISNDFHVLDGHHRWLADYNTDKSLTSAYVIDLPILELYRVAKEYCCALNESIEHKDFAPMVDEFVSFASDQLGIKSIPHVSMGGEGDKSFGGYTPGNKSISVVTKNRHPMDIFRTLAHELVHHKQNEDGKLKDIAKAGATGSPIEDEANSMAGRLMRMYGQANPNHFKLQGLAEATFVVGVPCSGKDAIIRNLTTEETQEIDIIKLFGASELSETVIVSSSAEDVDTIRMAKKLLEDNGYITNLVFVDVDDTVSKYRNEQRRERGQRVLNESIRFTKYNKAKENMKTLKELFGSNMEVVENDVLNEKKGFAQKAKQAGLERQLRASPDKDKIDSDYLTKSTTLLGVKMAAAVAKSPKVDSPNVDAPNAVKNMTARALGKSAPKTFKKTKKLTLRMKNPDPTGFDKEDDLKAIKSNQDSANKFKVNLGMTRASASTTSKSTQPSEKRKTFADHMMDFHKTGKFNYKAAKQSIHQDYEAKKVDQVLGHMAKDIRKSDLDKARKTHRISQGKSPESPVRRAIGAVKNWVSDDSADGKARRTARRDRIKRYGYFKEDAPSDREEATKSLRKKYTKETPGQKFREDGIGPTIQAGRTPLNGIAESIENWATNPETIERYNKRYGHQAQKKLNETVSKLKRMPPIDTVRKTVTAIRENWDSISGADMGTVPNTAIKLPEDGKRLTKKLKRKNNK